MSFVIGLKLEVWILIDATFQQVALLWALTALNIFLTAYRTEIKGILQDLHGSLEIEFLKVKCVMVIVMEEMMVEIEEVVFKKDGLHKKIFLPKEYSNKVDP